MMAPNYGFFSSLLNGGGEGVGQELGPAVFLQPGDDAGVPFGVEEIEREIKKAYQMGKEIEAQRRRRMQLLWIPIILLLLALNIVLRL